MSTYVKNLSRIFSKYIIINVLLPIVFLAIVYFFHPISLPQKYNMYMSLLLMLFILFFILKGRKGFEKDIAVLKNKPLGEKLNMYEKKYSLRLSYFSAIGAVACIGMFLSSNYMYMIFCAFAILLIILNKPTLVKISFELGLTEEEKSRLDN